MKIPITYLLSVLSLFICARTMGQEVPEPDFTLRPYFFDGNALKDFERVDATLQTKSKALGYGGSDVFYVAQGAKSNVRVSSSSIPKIIVKTEDNSDPAELMIFVVGEVKKELRKFKSSKMSGPYGGGMKSVSDNRIQVAFKKIRDKVFEISFGQT